MYCLRVCMSVCMGGCTCVCIVWHVCECVHMWMSVYVRVCMSVRACVHQEGRNVGRNPPRRDNLTHPAPVRRRLGCRSERWGARGSRSAQTGRPSAAARAQSSRGGERVLQPRGASRPESEASVLSLKVTTAAAGSATVKAPPSPLPRPPEGRGHEAVSPRLA